MTGRIHRWLTRKWEPKNDLSMLRAYQLAFSTVEGQIVLQDLLDRVYCQVPHTKDPLELAEHAGARALIHGILEKIDMAEYPDKYNIRTEEFSHADRS